jgi:outer membrane protein assembly factor BamB
MPEVLWEHEARQLWAQTVPARDAVLLIEKERLLFRQVSTGAVLWEQPSPSSPSGAVPNELAVDGAGLLLAAGQDLRELDPATGKERWRVRLGGTIAALALDDEVVYAAATPRGPIFALDRTSGNTVWRAPFRGEPELYPHPEAGLLVVSDPEAEAIQGYDTRSGARRWEFRSEGQPAVAGPLAKGLLFVSAHEGGAAAVDAGTGAIRWRVETDGAVETPGVLLGSQVYFTDGNVYAADAATGRMAWKRTLEGEKEKVFTLRVEGDLLLAETWGGRLLALDPVDGGVHWEQATGQVHGTASDEKHLYLRANTPEPESQWIVAALERSSGRRDWELRARRMIPDLTRVGSVLVVEFKTQVVAIRC